MRLLGAVLAGGEARRFGSDKALAEFEGQTLIDHAIAALRPQVEAVVLCGRDWNGIERLDDLPEPGLGPMGAINAALQHADRHGFDGVISAPVDVMPLPAGLRELLDVASGEAVALADQHLVAFWPVAARSTVEDYVAGGGRRIVGALDLIGARRVSDPAGLVNINRPKDLNRLST